MATADEKGNKYKHLRTSGGYQCQVCAFLTPQQFSAYILQVVQMHTKDINKCSYQHYLFITTPKLEGAQIFLKTKMT